MRGYGNEIAEEALLFRKSRFRSVLKEAWGNALHYLEEANSHVIFARRYSVQKGRFIPDGLL
jgi:hypothetical protein